jgi:hypothetical protein
MISNFYSILIFRSAIEKITGQFFRLFESKILNGVLDKRLFDLCEFFNQELAQWQLLYRGSEHGFNTADFNSNLSKHANILFLVRTFDGFIFGGYTRNLLQHDGGGNHSFVFSLINEGSDEIKIKRSSTGANNNNNSCSSLCERDQPLVNNGLGGIKFHNDFFIADNCNSNTNSFARLYCIDRESRASPPSGSFHFQVSEFEVFQRA